MMGLLWFIAGFILGFIAGAFGILALLIGAGPGPVPDDYDAEGGDADDE